MKIIPIWYSNKKYWQILNQLAFGKLLSCPKCGTIKMSENYQGRYVWCKHCRAKHRYSAAKRTFLYGCKLQPLMLYKLLWCFLNRMSIETIRTETKLSYVTIGRWVKRFRENLSHDTESKPKLTGVIKIDESFFGKRRSKQEQLIVIGAVNADTNEIRLEIIPDREAETLEDFVLSNIEKGSTIVSDSWLGYINLQWLGYDHIAFNHSKGQFAHTNQIESLWAEIKGSLRRIHGNILTKDLQLILSEYEARHNHPELFESVESFLKYVLQKF